MAGLGAELVQADLSSVESLAKAFASANAIFINTDYWGVYRAAQAAGKSDDENWPMAYNNEITWGKNAAKAASQIPELKRYIYSAFGSMKAASNGKYRRCHHFETKGVVVKYITEQLPQLAAKTSYIYASAYSDNPGLYPRKVPAGTSWVLWVLTKLPFLLRFVPTPPPPNQRKKVTGSAQYLMILPAKISPKLPVFIPNESTGGFVRALIEDEKPGTKLLAVDWWISYDEGMKTWEKVTGQKAQSMYVPVDVICKTTGLKEEVVEGGAYLAEFPYMCEITDYIEPEKLKNPPAKALPFEEYLRTRPMDELMG